MIIIIVVIVIVAVIVIAVIITIIVTPSTVLRGPIGSSTEGHSGAVRMRVPHPRHRFCLLYTSDAADDTPCVDL
eukprot:9013453-Pyramimonas_sp.AAC.1